MKGLCVLAALVLIAIPSHAQLNYGRSRSCRPK
jgi:hypothetical protein